MFCDVEEGPDVTVAVVCDVAVDAVVAEPPSLPSLVLLLVESLVEVVPESEPELEPSEVDGDDVGKGVAVAAFEEEEDEGMSCGKRPCKRPDAVGVEEVRDEERVACGVKL